MSSNKRIPVILTSFGNRKGSSEVRSFLENRFRERFPNCDFYWALGSHFLQKLEDPSLPPPPEVILENLHKKGHKKAIIQSLHIAPAKEYEKLVNLSSQASFPVHVTSPLLSCKEDCREAALVFTELKALAGDTAALLVLHGSSHEGGKIFHLMGEVFMETWGTQAFFALIEGIPTAGELAEKITEAGFSKILLIPFILASGYHLEKDILEGENSWKALFEKKGFKVGMEKAGLGLHPKIADIFANHLEKILKEL